MSTLLPAQTRDDLILRLRKIEGQAQGIQRMLAEGRDCREVLNQLASVRAATHHASLELLRYYALTCLGDPGEARSEAQVNAMLDLLLDGR
jgi:CsoR family transcriptional regulator, copper-sensing transcriptional repressor